MAGRSAKPSSKRSCSLFYSETIFSIARLAVLSRLSWVQDPTWDYATYLMWSTIQENIGIFCACVPMLRPLLRSIDTVSSAWGSIVSKIPPPSSSRAQSVGGDRLSSIELAKFPPNFGLPGDCIHIQTEITVEEMEAGEAGFGMPKPLLARNWERVEFQQPRRPVSACSR